MSKSSMRESMPLTAAFIDSLRAAFGKEMIDGQIRRGMNGEATFYASENGHEVGTKIPAGRVSLDIANGAAKTRKITGSGE